MDLLNKIKIIQLSTSSTYPKQAHLQSKNLQKGIRNFKIFKFQKFLPSFYQNFQIELGLWSLRFPVCSEFITVFYRVKCTFLYSMHHILQKVIEKKEVS